MAKPNCATSVDIHSTLPVVPLGSASAARPFGTSVEGGRTTATPHHHHACGKAAACWGRGVPPHGC